MTATRPARLRAVLAAWQGSRCQWVARADGLIHRAYPSIAVYRAHQRAKILGLDLRAYDAALIANLTARCRVTPPASPVLCLGARTGAEVRAFRDMGCLAFGVDLAPAGPLVIPADFHALPFRAQTVRTVYCNAFDHAHDPTRLLSEIARVLSRNGQLWLDLSGATHPGDFEACWWPDLDTLRYFLEQRRFQIIHTEHIQWPPGKHHWCLTSDPRTNT